MSQHFIHNDELVDFRNRLLNFSKGNALFHLSEKYWVSGEQDVDGFYDQEISQPLEKIYSKGRNYEKSTGISPWKKTLGVLHWWDNRKEESIASPLFLNDGFLEKVKGPVTRFRFVERREWFLNPVLSYYFKELYGVHLKFDETISEEELIKQCIDQLEQNISKLSVNGEITNVEPLLWQIKTETGLGVFNSGSYAFLHEYQYFIDNKIEPSFELQPHKNENHSIPGFVQRPDPSQLEVLEQASQGKSLLITGPPGTGKSSLIVNIIADGLVQGKKILFVSEKKTALDVVYQQLINKGFGHLCSYYHHRLSNTDWVDKLKQSFEYFRESQLNDNADELSAIKEEISRKKDYFRQYSSVLVEKVPGTEKTVQDLILFLETHQSLIFDDLAEKLQLFSIHAQQIQNNRDTLQQMVGQIKQFTIDKAVVLKMKPHFFTEQPEPEKALKNILNHITVSGNKFKELFPQNLPGIQTLKELSLVATGLHHDFSAYQKILSTTSEKERFIKWSHELLAGKKALEEAASIIKIDNDKIPSPSELKDIKVNINQPKKWYSFLQSNKKIPLFSPLNQLNDLKSKNDFIDRCIDYQEKRMQWAEKEARLRSRYHIKISDAELEMMLTGVERMNRYHTAVEFIIKHPESEAFLERIKKADHDIERFYRGILHIWGSNAVQWTVDEVLNEAEKLKEYIGLFELVAPGLKNMEKNDRHLFLPLVMAENLESLETNLLYAELQKHLKYRPIYTAHSNEDYSDKIRIFNVGFEEYIQNVKRYVLKQHQNIVTGYLELTEKYAKEIPKEKKPFRKKLQQGKRLIFREFSKSMRHLSPYQMLENEAGDWVKSLHPVWIMNTLSVSESLPLEKDQFDWVIFDEASQIPVEHAIPAIYRAKKVLIVGDEQQMPPSQFFATSISEEDRDISLMAYFKSDLKELSLKWHYRSEHPQLIAFSNQYFYNNTLIPLPQMEEKSSPIGHTFISEGRFIDRKNEKEAKAIEKHLIQTDYGNDSVAIVCFSDAQCKRVESLLGEPDNINIMSLEHVQGEEYDHVLISMAYGKNEEGKFQYYLGPLNRPDGKKRLNVLMSRAKKSMHLFHSVMPEDFTKKYDNPSIEMLYRMLVFFVETKQNKTSQRKNIYPEPLGKVMNQQGGKLSISDEFGAHQLLSEAPLNAGFIKHLFQVMNIEVEEQTIRNRWQKIIEGEIQKKDYQG